MDRWKSKGVKSQGGEDKKWEDQRREREGRKKMQEHEKVGKSWFTVLFQWFVALEGRKVGLLKRRVRSQLARWEMKSCTPLWREAHFEVKKLKTPHDRTIFGSWDVEKVHAVVARSTFPSQIVQNTTCSDHFWKCRGRKRERQLWREARFQVKSVKNWRASEHFWKFWCGKSVRRCGAKHISKPKFTKHTTFSALLEVERLKKWTPLWREAHFQVKSAKNCRFGALLDVQMSKKCMLWWCEAHLEVKSVKGWSTFGFWAFFDVQMSKKCTLTSLANFTTLTHLAHFTNLTHLTKWATLSN